MIGSILDVGDVGTPRCPELDRASQGYDGSHDHQGHHILAEPSNFIEVEQEMTFVGMVGILDPPRPECKPAIEAHDCSSLGQEVKLEGSGSWFYVTNISLHRPLRLIVGGVKSQIL